MLVTAATGRTRTIAARRMSLTTITSLWSQRSTNVPAIGLRSRFGSVAAKKIRPVANAEPVAVATTKTSASWLNRSPKSEMSCPAHSAENEPLSARRTYGCWRTRSTVSGDGRVPGRRKAGLVALVSGAGRPAGTRGGQSGLGGCSELLLECRRHAHDGGEQEEGKAKRQEGIPDRRHVLDDRQRDGDDVGERAQVQEEVGIKGGRQDVMERPDIGPLETGQSQGRLPDRHVAAVD